LWRNRFLLCDDVANGRITPAAPSQRIVVSDRQYAGLADRAAALRQIFANAHDISQCVRAIWPQLSLVSSWADGSSFAYANDLRKLLDGIPLQPKGLLATEGVVSIPLSSQPGPVLAVRSHFFEFIPAGDGANDDACPLLAHELEQGRRYQVVITTQGGLYRYRMHDEIEVVNHYREAPSIRFVGKADLTSDLVGEKLSAAQAEAAIQGALSALGLAPRFAQLAPQRRPPGYILRVLDDSLSCDAETCQRLRDRVEAGLAANPAYRYAVQLRQLAPLTVNALIGSEADSLIEDQYSRQLQAGRRLGDIKMPSIFGDAG
jgi:hypothetical protein